MFGYKYESSTDIEWIQIFHQIVARTDMFMSYMHCSIIRIVTHEYWALLGVTAFSSLVAPGLGFLVARGDTGGGRVVTVTTLLFTVNIFQACRRGGAVLIFVAFSSLAAPEVLTMKISDGAGGASMALGWRRLRLSEQRLSFWWYYTYWYLNGHPIILWSRYFIVNSICISFQMYLL